MNTMINVVTIMILSLVACGICVTDKTDVVKEEMEWYYNPRLTNDTIQKRTTNKITSPQPIENLLKVKWIGLIETPNGNQNLPHGKPLVVNGIVFPGAISTHVFEAVSGKKLYFNNPEERQKINNSAKDSLLFFSTRYQAKVMNIKNGDIIHTFKQDAYMSFVEKMRLMNRGLIPAVNKTELGLYDIKSGILKARYHSSSLINYNMLIEENYVFFGDREGVYFMNLDGMIQDSLKLGRLSSKPILNGNMIYVYIRKKGVFAISSSSNEVKWHYSDNNYEANFVISGDTLMVNNGCIVKLNKETGIFYEKSEIDEGCNLSEEHFFYKNSIVVSYIKGFSNIPIICSPNLHTGNLEYLNWKDASVFDVDGLFKHEPVHSEDDIVKFLGPIFKFSEVYDNMIFGQWENMVVGFEIISVKK